MHAEFEGLQVTITTQQSIRRGLEVRADHVLLLDNDICGSRWGPVNAFIAQLNARRALRPCTITLRILDENIPAGENGDECTRDFRSLQASQARATRRRLTAGAWREDSSRSWDSIWQAQARSYDVAITSGVAGGGVLSGMGILWVFTVASRRGVTGERLEKIVQRIHCLATDFTERPSPLALYITVTI